MTRIVVVAALALVVGIADIASASISGNPSTFSVSADGTRLLVMRSPSPLQNPEPPVVLPNGRMGTIRDLFEKSGVYDAETLEPVLQVDW